MIITSEQFNNAYKKLPLVLREYIAKDDLTEITEEIGNRYQLHVDTTGALYRETTNMLLGFINPEQFVGELKSVGVPEASIGAIVEELNTKVFIPLREEMKNPSASLIEDEEDDTLGSIAQTQSPITTPAVQYSAPAQQYVPPAPPPITYAPQPIPEPVRAPVVETPTYITPAPPATIAPGVSVLNRTISPEPPILPGQIIAPAHTPVVAPAAPPINAPVFVPTPVASVPQSGPDTPVSTPKPAQPAPATYIGMSETVEFTPPAPSPIPEHVVAPHARTMQEDMQNLSHAPAANAPTTSAVAMPTAPVTHSTPPTQMPPSFVTSPVRPASMPTPTRQSPTPPPVAPPRQSGPIPSSSSAPSTNRDDLHAVLKAYGVDPYREPPE